MPLCFKRLGTMVDCSRNAVRSVSFLKEWIDLTSSMGYNTLLLYTEDTYAPDGEPYFGYLRGRYSKAELKELVTYAKQRGVEMIPCIQTLAHLGSIFRWSAYADVHDTDDILLCDEERTYALIANMLDFCRECFHTDRIHIGMDEAHAVGRGQYLDRHGLVDRFELLNRHVRRVADLCEARGFHPMMWSDMYFRLCNGGEYCGGNGEIPTEAQAGVPQNVEMAYWDYYSHDQERYAEMIRRHAFSQQKPWFAGGAWCWSGFVPHNAFALKATEAALPMCEAGGVENVFLTLWGDNGAETSPLMMLPTLHYAACFAKGVRDMDAVKADFLRMFGLSFDDFCLLDLPGSPGFDEKQIRNPDKYMLYNDPFLGAFDRFAPFGCGQDYEKLADKLAPFTENERFGYLFASQQALCRLLALKYDLGVRLHNAYQKGDSVKLALLAGDLRTCATRVEAFEDVFFRLWKRENKPHGFDVQTLRLGGLANRCRHCAARVDAFLSGADASIPELEEEILPWGGWGACDTGHTERNVYTEIATVNGV